MQERKNKKESDVHQVNVQQHIALTNLFSQYIFVTYFSVNKKGKKEEEEEKEEKTTTLA